MLESAPAMPFIPLHFLSRNLMRLQLSAIACVLLLSGCGREAAPAPAAADTAPPAAATTVAIASAATVPEVAPAAAAIGDATLSVTPGSFRACEAKDGAITATARWDVTDKGVKEVAIYVESPNNERKLWLNGGATGESTTGNWVFDQSHFEMVERGTEKPIAELTVKATPCE